MRARWLALAAVVWLGCGSDSTGSTSSTDDGRFHPATNGVSVSEDAACEAVHDAYAARFSALACVGTGQICPAFLRLSQGSTCSTYDEGTATGCSAFMAEQATCDDLTQAPAACALAGIDCP